MKILEIINNGKELNKLSVPDLLALGVDSKDCFEYFNWVKLETPKCYNDRTLRQDDILIKISEEQFSDWKVECETWVRTFKEAERFCSKVFDYFNKEAIEFLDGANQKHYVKTRFNYSSHTAVDYFVDDLKEAQNRLIKKLDQEKIVTKTMIDAMIFLATKGRIASQDYNPKDSIIIASEIFVQEEIRKQIGEKIAIDFCEYCSVWVAGENRCSCGNRKVYWESMGEYPSQYIYPQAD